MPSQGQGHHHDPVELVVFSASGVATYALPPGKQLTVGRGEDVDIVIDDVAVSRKHAVFNAGPPLEVEDLGSANGTFVSTAEARAARGGHGDRTAQTADQRRVAAQKMTLNVGDTVFFGPALVLVRAAKSARAGAAAASAMKDSAIVVRDPNIERLYDEASRVAAASLPVLIMGETGVGKDVLARFIHQKSPRAQKPFIALNCAALSESLAESELFGHEKGAFTGAQQARAGLFESADGGTVFLDEIGELPLATQAKLLRTLESSEVTRLGSSKPIHVDVRFVSATNRDLQKAAASGRFRQDLYFRVNGLTLKVPPLRERPSEIPDLARAFLDSAARKMGTPVPPQISPQALEALEAHAWPGNVRELRFVMERALVLAGVGPILADHLPPEVLSPASNSFREPLATREQVIEALDKVDGNQTKAAELLGVSRRTLINRMIEFELPRPYKKV